MGGEYGPLRRRHSGKGRAVPERQPVDPYSLLATQNDLMPLEHGCDGETVMTSFDSWGRKMMIDIDLDSWEVGYADGQFDRPS
jgi:hypothetical protein